nr:MAG TPA: hypothetical protein [Caudoviricetes sp.]
MRRELGNPLKPRPYHGAGFRAIMALSNYNEWRCL